jgi:diaminopimelate decarboxylase
MFNYKNNKLYCENVSLENIIKKIGTPVYVYSKNKIIMNYTDYDRAFSSISHIICYAVKANTNYNICKTIFSLGGGADVTSGGELYRVLNAGVDVNKITFAGVGKTEQEIKYALEKNIFMFNVESIQELELINKIGSKLHKVPNISIRINPNIDPHTHKYISTGKNENKFGIPIRESIKIYLNSKKYKNLNICGIHCHIGSQITSIEPFILMAKKIYEIVHLLKSKGVNIKYVDIGGGLGIRYYNETPPTPYQLAKEIVPVLKPLNIVLILEPGRYIVGNTGILVTKILYYKYGQKKKFLIVDAGMSELIRPTLYGAYHEIVPVIKHNEQIRFEKIDIVGPICETGDFFAIDRDFPVVNTGEYLAVKNAGAYGFTMSSQYNSRCRPPEIMVDKNKWYMIRKREDYRTLISTEIIGK